MIKIFVVDHSKVKGVNKIELITEPNPMVTEQITEPDQMVTELITEPDQMVTELITEPDLMVTELITEPDPMVQTALIVQIIIIPVIRVNYVNETYSQIVAATLL